MTQQGILLCGHGSKKQYNKELIVNTAKRISDTHPQYIVKCGFMEANEPTISQALDEFRTEEISALAVVPLFLARGVHIDEDIPRILGFEEGQKVGTFKTNNGEVPLSYAAPIGEHPFLADVMVASAEDAFKLIQ